MAEQEQSGVTMDEVWVCMGTAGQGVSGGRQSNHAPENREAATL